MLDHLLDPPDTTERYDAHAAAAERADADNDERYLREIGAYDPAVPVSVLATFELVSALRIAREAMRECAAVYTTEIDMLLKSLLAARITARREREHS